MTKKSLVKKRPLTKAKQMIGEGKRISAICRQMDISYSTLRRILLRGPISRGNVKDAIDWEEKSSDWEKDYMEGMAVNGQPKA